MDICQYDLNQFHILGPGVANFSTSELKLSSTTIAFSKAAAAELGYPEYIVMLASPDARFLAIRPMSPQEDPAQIGTRFYNRELRPRQIVIHDRDCARALRAEHKWTDKTAWRVPGFRLNDKVLLFDFNLAYAGAKVRKQHFTLSSYPTMKDVQENFRTILALPEAVVV